ncbi:MAG: M28 family peptidase [Gemmiger sp.]
MELQTHLAALAQPEPGARRAALEAALRAEGFVPEIQTEEPSEKTPIPAVNYLLLPPEQTPCPLLCAHYDAHPGSPGANDNAAALCILLALAKTLRQKGIPAAFAFLDGEEQGHTGAKLLEAQREREFSVVVNLDVCGYGDTIALYAKGGEKKPAAAVFCDKKRLAAHGGRMVRYLPEGDERCFHSRRQPVLALSVMPRWDTKYLDAIAAQGGGLLGRPPEMQMILGQMEVMSTMHGGFKDKVQWVQPAAMQQVYDYLLDALSAPPAPVRRFGLF